MEDALEALAQGRVPLARILPTPMPQLGLIARHSERWRPAGPGRLPASALWRTSCDVPCAGRKMLALHVPRA